MAAKILIIQEAIEKSDAYAGYKAFSDILGYENQVCHDAHTFPEIIKVFEPDIIFWIRPRSYEIDNIILKYRQQKGDVLLNLMDDGPVGHLVRPPSNYCDHLFYQVILGTNTFQKIVTEWFLKSLKNDPNNLTKQNFLYNLSDNALRAVVSEQMWSGDKGWLESLMERDKQDRLDKDKQGILAELIQKRDQLLKRKAEAASILIERGYSGSVEELIAESKRLD